MEKVNKTFISLAYKSLIESKIIEYKSNIHKMHGPNIHVVFSPKNKFKEFQLHQTLIFFSEFWHISRSEHSREKCICDFPKEN